MQPIPKNTSQPRTWRRTLIFVFMGLLWFGGLGAAALHRQDIVDWWRLRSYDAPAVVTQLATDDTMSPYARKILYVNAPQLQAKASFDQCNLGSEQAAVLGCYHSNQQGIFILDVTDPRLSGIEQVTAAHEMLHAAYDRLSSHKKQQIDGWLQDYYDHGLTDDSIRQQINEYKRTEPNALVDEMHSIFGTEVANLPSNLEQYYGQYFAQRSKVTGYYTAYEGEFTSRETTIKADDSQLDSLKVKIDDLESTVETQSNDLTNQRAQLDTYRQSDQIATYNQNVVRYNALIDTYNSNVDNLKAQISQYNQLVQSRNNLALESQQLANEITTNPQPLSQK